MSQLPSWYQRINLPHPVKADVLHAQWPAEWSGNPVFYVSGLAVSIMVRDEVLDLLRRLLREGI